MRIYAYEDRFGDPRFGVLVADRLLTGAQLEKRGGLEAGLTHVGLGVAIQVDRRWRQTLERATRRALKGRAPLIKPAKRKPVAVIDQQGLGGKVVCVGLNYGDHAREGGREAPDWPLLFAKFANAIVGDGEAIVRPPGTHALDLEVELGVVIGRTARRVTEAEAMAHVAGYVVVNDVSARDWQGSPPALREGEKGDGQWLRAKGSDTFLPVGPVFVTPDELDPASGLALRSWRTPAAGLDAGTPVLMQDGTTADMLVGVPALVSFISQQITLEPGDLIATGTPAGVGVFQDPKVLLQDGDEVSVEIEGLGTLTNPVEKER
jgi:2,4-didehydro-3-deoxy-L-rhamnonate hydrolase